MESAYMNKVFVGTPTKYDQNDTDYVWALCKCPLPANYGIRIPREKDKTEYGFECEDCGYRGIVLTQRIVELPEDIINMGC